MGYNYLVRKQVVTLEGGSDWRGESQILEFIEARPGIFFPTKCRKQSYRGGKVASEDWTTLTDVHINEEIPPSVFDLPPIPRGTILSDHIAGTRYAVDENWKQIQPAEPLLKGFVTSPGGALEGGQRSQSTREPAPPGRWLLLVALVVFGLAGACWLYRRYRAPAE